LSHRRDDHGFSPLHWAAKEGHLKIVEMLVQRGARINSTNRGDDTPLHLAAAHGHHEIVHLVSFTVVSLIVDISICSIANTLVIVVEKPC